GPHAPRWLDWMWITSVSAVRSANFDIFRVMPESEDEDLPNASAGTTRRPYPETRLTVWAKSLGVVLVGIAGVILSFVGLQIQRSVADVQQSVAENQRRNSVDELA